MFAAIQRVIENLKGTPEDKPFETLDHRLATAVLAVHAIAIDGMVSDDERARLRGALRQRFELSDPETDALIEEARRRDLEAVDLYAFTSVIKRALDEDERREVVELLWQVVHADGEVHEFEDNLIWRVSELLGVSARDRIHLRKKVREAGDPAPEAE